MKNLEKELKYLKQVLEEYEFTFQEILQLLEWSQKKRKLYKQIINLKMKAFSGEKFQLVTEILDLLIFLEKKVSLYLEII